jgi:hypothetical protein
MTICIDDFARVIKLMALIVVYDARLMTEAFRNTSVIHRGL